MNWFNYRAPKRNESCLYWEVITVPDGESSFVHLYAH